MRAVGLFEGGLEEMVPTRRVVRERKRVTSSDIRPETTSGEMRKEAQEVITIRQLGKKYVKARWAHFLLSWMLKPLCACPSLSDKPSWSDQAFTS